MTKISKEKMEHWDYSENDISPEELTNGSHKKVNWICEEGHQWNTSVKDKGTCPYCLGRKVGYGNDLLTNFPNVKNIWDYSKNSKKPEDVLAQGRTKFYFKCNKGHSYKTEARSVARGYGCPYCAGKKIDKSNSLAATHPEIAKEYSKKNAVPATKVLAGANKKVLWECKKGHEWESRIDHRALRNTSCPECKLHGTSKPELFLRDKLKEIYKNVLHRHKTEYGEIDIFIPELNIGVEYDGEYWHKDKVEKDTKKVKNLKEKKGITVINLRAGSLPMISKNSYRVKDTRTNKQLQELADFVLGKIGEIV
tara:strand:+ start:1024 stop:1950 length:927 start_codon:yes stop_codon:yes gene_type:complete